MSEKMLLLGTQPALPEYVNNKIRTTNMVALGLLLVASAYAGISIAVYPQLTYLPLLGLFFILSGIGAASLGLHYLYRIIISLVPVFVCLFYHQGLIAEGSTPLASTLLLQGAFSLLPFIIFDLREKEYLILSGLISFTGIVFFRQTDGWIEYGLDDSLFRTGPMHEVTVAVAMLIIYGSVFALSGMNLRSENRSEKLLEESRRKNEELNSQQAETERSLVKLQEAQEEERKRAWASEGFSTFGTLMRESTNLQKTYDELISGIVKYVGANQAGLYVAEDKEDELQLRLKASYAYDRKKYRDHAVQPGEGLVGQAYLEKDYIYLTDIPNGYTHITSGLGEATPSALLILPLLNNGKVEGILEIAAFQPFEKHVIAFLMELGEDIASSININRVNEMTRLLLEKSQVQTEELRAQEEEMRQNMEELEATQEEMKRKEVETRGQLAAINNTVAYVEFDLQGNIITANQSFLKLMGYSLEEIKGRHHRVFCEKAYANSEEYAAFWQSLGQGTANTSEFRRISKSRQEVWLRASYTPVLDNAGNPVKIIKCAFDITGEKQQNLDVKGQLEAINLSNAVIEFTPDGHILRANKIFLELMKYREEELIGRHHRMFVTEEGQSAEEYKTHWETLCSGNNLAGEFLRVNSQGERTWIKGTYSPVFDLGGKVLKIVKIAQDISQEKKLEEERILQLEQLKAQEEEMRQNIEEMQATQEELARRFEENEKIKKDLDAYLKTLDKAALMSEADLYGNIINVNDRFCEVAKYSREEVMGKPHNILRHPDNPKELFKEMWTNLKAGKVFKGRYPNKAKDGSTYWVDATIEPVLGDDGKPVKYIGIRFDVTEQVEREKEIEGLLEELDGKVWEMKMKEEQLQKYVDKIKEAESTAK